MALLFMEGFGGQDYTYKWDSGSLGYTTSTGSPRTPGNYYGQISNGAGGGSGNYKVIPAANKVFTGVGLKCDTSWLISFYGDTGATQHITVMRNTSTGFIEIRRGNQTGTLLATGTTNLFVSTWYYVEVSCTISDTVGEVHVRINGQTTDEVSYTGDTKNGGTNTTIDKLGYVDFGAYAGLSISDLYVLDDTGTTQNNFLGDVVVRTLSPSGNGTYSQLVGSDGDSVNNYQLVDEHPFSSSDYVGSATTGQKDSYTLADLPAGVTTVYGVQVSSMMAKSDATLAQARMFVRSGGTDYPGTTQALTTSYINYYQLFPTDPATGSSWTATAINNFETGMEVM